MYQIASASADYEIGNEQFGPCVVWKFKPNKYTYSFELREDQFVR